MSELTQVLRQMGEALANDPKHNAPPVFAHVIQEAVTAISEMTEALRAIEAFSDDTLAKNTAHNALAELFPTPSNTDRSGEAE